MSVFRPAALALALATALSAGAYAPAVQAANAPAVSNAVNASPHTPPSTWDGSATTAVSVAPVR